MIFWRIFRLELREAFRHSAEIANPLVFLIVITLFPLSIGRSRNCWRVLHGHHLGCCVAFILAGTRRLFRDDLQDGSRTIDVVAVTLARRCAGEGDGALDGNRSTVTHPSPLVAMLLGNDVYRWQVMALTLLLGTPTLGFLGAPGVALTVGLKRGGVLLSILVLPLTIPLLVFATAAMDAASMHLPVDGYLAILGALLAGTATLSPFATAAALRISIQ
ncbi:heme exporter protein CcmB [Shigella sonnei]